MSDSLTARAHSEWRVNGRVYDYQVGEHDCAIAQHKLEGFTNDGID